MGIFMYIVAMPVVSCVGGPCPFLSVGVFVLLYGFVVFQYIWCLLLFMGEIISSPNLRTACSLSKWVTFLLLFIYLNK